MEPQQITVTLEAGFIYLRSGRPETFGLDYHIQRDDYLRLELPENPRIIDVYLMGTKGHAQQQQIIEIAATPYLDMLMEDLPAPKWTRPVEHVPEGGLRIVFMPE
jgi:hypothetical protein